MTENSDTPREWKDKIPIIIKCAEEGYKYYRRTMAGKPYMILRKGYHMKSLGRWSEEKERMLSALFPNINQARLHRATPSNEAVLSAAEMFRQELNKTAEQDAETYVRRVHHHFPATTKARTEQVIVCLCCGSKWRIRQSGIAAELLECPLCIAEAEQK